MPPRQCSGQARWKHLFSIDAAMRLMCPGLYLLQCKLHPSLVEPRTDSGRTPKIFLQGGIWVLTYSKPESGNIEGPGMKTFNGGKWTWFMFHGERFDGWMISTFIQHMFSLFWKGWQSSLSLWRLPANALDLTLSFREWHNSQITSLWLNRSQITYSWPITIMSAGVSSIYIKIMSDDSIIFEQTCRLVLGSENHMIRRQSPSQPLPMNSLHLSTSTTVVPVGIS